MTVPNKPAPLRLLLPLAAALAVVACKPAEDPAAIAARQKAAIEQAADEAAKQFDAEYGRHNWELAKAHGDVLIDKYPDSTAAARIKERHAEAVTKAVDAREQRRLSSLWSYGNEPAGKGSQLSASIYSQEPVDTGGGAQPVRLIFRDHPEWGTSSYLVLEAGDFNCYAGCKVKVKADDAAPRPMAATRPKTDEAIAMFIEDEKALWKLARDAKVIEIEFPVKAGGTRTAVFEVAALDTTSLPKWPQ